MSKSHFIDPLARAIISKQLAKQRADKSIRDTRINPEDVMLESQLREAQQYLQHTEGFGRSNHKIDYDA